MKIACTLILLLATPVFAKPQIVTLKTRPNVKLSFLLDQPQQLRRGTVVLFTGGNGTSGFTYRKGKVTLGQNFLARATPWFLSRGYAVVLLGVPSDLKNGYSDAFRTSEEHRKDMAAVVEYLIQKGLDTLNFIGTSRGCLSATWLASRLDPLYVKQVILTAVVSEQISAPLASEIKQPTLIIHHTEDPCRTAPYEAAVQLRKRFTRSPRFSFVGVVDGTPSDPKARKCSGATQHGFYGKEQTVASAIADWIEGKDPAPKI